MLKKCLPFELSFTHFLGMQTGKERSPVEFVEHEESSLPMLHKLVSLSVLGFFVLRAF